MPSTFFGVEIGSRALAANQLGLDVVGQNTANINTPGYSRQVVNLDETDPYTVPDASQTTPSQLGTGVTVTSVTSVRDQFVDNQVLNANSDQGALNQLVSITGQVESAYNEPSDTGIGQLMTNLFNSFSDLSANPESGAIRATVRNNAETLVASFHSISNTLGQVAPEIQAEIANKVGNVNTIATQIAGLNSQIRLSIASGQQPNDLQDKRQALLEQLSNLVDVQVTNTVSTQTGQPTGEVQVNVGGYALVQGDTANALPATTLSANGTYGLVTSTNETIPLQGGEIYGLIKATSLVNGYQSDLNTLASNLVSAVNNINKSGYGLDGLNNHQFFTDPTPGTPVTAASISVSADVEGNLNAIAAASAPAAGSTFASGNGDNARLISELTNTQVIGGFSLNDFYAAKVAQVGADSASFQSQSDNQTKVVTMLQNQQSSVSGVNLDEELTKMLQYQNGYQAAARLINVMDNAISLVINSMGTGTTTG